MPTNTKTKLSLIIRGFCGFIALGSVLVAIFIGVVPDEPMWNYLFLPSAIICFPVLGYVAISGVSPFPE